MEARVQHQDEYRAQNVLERCVCAGCGAHLDCTVGLATIGGLCTVCGGTTAVPLDRRGGASSSRRFALASASEIGMLGESGYRGIVLDRLAKQAAEILELDGSCIYARDQHDSTMSIVVAAHGPAEGSVGRRLNTSCEPAPSVRSRRAAMRLQWDGEVQGSLTVSAKADAREFKPQELAVLRSLAVAAGAALAHAYERPAVSGDIRDPIGKLATSLADLDARTAEHSRDVVKLACKIGEAAGFSRAALTELAVAALLHDVGKVRVPGSILGKRGPLTESEREVMAQHPGFGAEALTPVAGLEVVAILVRYHHEQWDGSGYPDGLYGRRIPRASRIIAASDAYSAMTSDRPYRDAMSHERALAELWACAGSQFDPEVVAHLEDVLARKVPA
jgi:HD-GYP domain-containing protein (c-di-GMP phosphodiesterase class II)